MSTLASVYHKPPEQFVGAGKYGAAAVQLAAIEEQLQNAREDPLAASAAATAAAVSGKVDDAAPAVVAQSNAENLLDIDFDAPPAPATPVTAQATGASGSAVPPPVAAGGAPKASSGLEDLMGAFGDSAPAAAPAPAPAQAPMATGTSTSNADLLAGLGGLNISSPQAPPAQTQTPAHSGQQGQGQGQRPQQPKSTQDIMDLF
ncbi:beta-adaptin [Ascosphaera atra]|nr:beta-adaptin [Ascosphaera atra]